MRPNTHDCTCIDPKTKAKTKAKLIAVAYHTLIYFCGICGRTIRVNVSPEEADEQIQRETQRAG
jgi:hypothetical protein